MTVTYLILVPLIGALVLAFVPRTTSGVLAKQIGLGTALLTLVLFAVLAASYQPDGGMQFTQQATWISAIGAHYAVGVDGLALTMLGLTALLTPIVMLASWNDHEEHRMGSYFALMLALEGLALGVFAATDTFLFYVLFEATLIPAYFLIGSFARRDDDETNAPAAALKFLLFMLGGGLIMLVSVIGLYVVSAQQGSATYLISDLAALDLGGTAGRWMFIGFFFAFAVKCPLFPAHTWLPDTTDAATPGTSVLLVCVLDKIGTYGMLRFCLELFPDASRWATPVVIALALISIVYGALVAIGQDNMLRLIGLTSLSHFGFIVLGIFVMNSRGVTGSMLFMVNHGLATALLFLVAGYLINRSGTASIRAHGGIEKVAPILAGTFLVGGLATCGLPGLAPFVSEFMITLGAFEHTWWVGAIAVTAIVWAAVYVLLMYARTFTGPVSPETPVSSDLELREIVAVGPILLLLVLFGFFPKPILDVVNPVTETTMTSVGTQDHTPTVGAVEEVHQ